MGRRVFNIFAGFSLLLCVATVGLWVRSTWVQDGLHRTSSVNALREYTFQDVYSRSGFLSLAATYRRNYRGWEPVSAEGWFHNVVKLPAADHAAYLSLMSKWGGTNLLGLRWGIDQFRENAYASRGGDIPESMDRRRFVVIPHWMVAVVTGLVPTWWIVGRGGRRRQDRRARGLCVICGYDLRASQERCPECGTPIPAGLVRGPIR